jgi:hypothetical protein
VTAQALGSSGRRRATGGVAMEAAA